MRSCGIDFGTSNTLAAFDDRDGIRLCSLDPANLDPHLLPTLLYFSRFGWNTVGREATHAYQKDPEGRFIRALKSALPDYTPEDLFRIFKQSFTLPELIRLVLQRARERVEELAGGPVQGVTLGRPVRFSTDPAVDRRAEAMLRTAAAEAGFQSVRFLTEPEAAIRYYFGRHEPSLADATVLVFDFGGGTLDLCLGTFGPAGYRILNTGGVSLGGTVLDRILFEQKILKHLGYGEKWGRGLELPRRTFQRLVNPDASWRISEWELANEARRILDMSTASGAPTRHFKAFYSVVSRRLGPELFSAIEAAKMRLSDVEETTIRFSAPEVEIRESLSRADLRVLFREELEQVRALIQRTLSEVGVTPAGVDRVLLAGGSSALICTQELLHELFGPERVPVRQDYFTSIVSGLALDACGGPAAAPAAGSFGAA